MKRQTIFEEYLEYHHQYVTKYGDQTVVLMEVGSFFELYGIETKDTQLGVVTEVGKLLNIVVTRKNKKIKENNFKNPLMAGFPNHALEKFLKILLAHNYTIILIEQVTPAPNPDRKVTHIYSPSTYLETSPNSFNQNLMSLYIAVSYTHLTLPTTPYV